MNKNEIYEIEITGITDDGNGVGKIEKMAVFVPYALLGERIRVIIIKVQKSYAVGKILDIIKPSENRVKSECEYFYRCGGCSFWNMTYEEELLYKHKTVEDCIRRIAKLGTEVLPVRGAENVKHYRNKAQFPVSADGIGIYAKKSHRVIDVPSCLIQSDDTERIVEAVKKWMKLYDVEPYDEITNSGCVRHIYTRSGNAETMVVIVTKGEKLKAPDKLIELVREADGRVCSIMQNINDKRTNVVLGEKLKLLWGKDHIVDNIGHREFKISPFSFYQVNNAQTKVLYDLAAKFACVSEKDVVWDMYCGIGTIGQYSASKAKKTIGVEIVESAIINAKENAKLNGLENFEYYLGAAEEVAPKLLKKGLKPYIIFLDPPRKGCDKALLDTVIDTGAKRIVYISCKPSTLARDLAYLAEKGYGVKKIQPVDLFPRTYHVECCLLLCRKDLIEE